MRRVHGLVGALAIFALAVGLIINRTAVAEQPGHVTISEDQPADGRQPALKPVPDLSPDDYCYTGARHRQNCYGRLLDKWAQVGNFNCSCRGSYKFPVPPQYTYHWPGMYSQQTMTQYNSPYRFPPLKQPPPEEAGPKADQEVGPPEQQGRFHIRQAGQVEPARPKLRASRLSAPESVSRKIKRHYCVN